jgi:hypothetical protein
LTESSGYAHIDGESYYRLKPKYPYIYVDDYLQAIPGPVYSAVEGTDSVDIGILLFLAVVASIGLAASIVKMQILELLCSTAIKSKQPKHERKKNGGWFGRFRSVLFPSNTTGNRSTSDFAAYSSLMSDEESLEGGGEQEQVHKRQDRTAETKTNSPPRGIFGRGDDEDDYDSDLESYDDEDSFAAKKKLVRMVFVKTNNSLSNSAIEDGEDAFSNGNSNNNSVKEKGQFEKSLRLPLPARSSIGEAPIDLLTGSPLQPHPPRPSFFTAPS